MSPSQMSFKSSTFSNIGLALDDVSKYTFSISTLIAALIVLS